MVNRVKDFLESNGLLVEETGANYLITKHPICTDFVLICGYISDSLPRELPSFYLCDRSSFGLLAHVGWPNDKDQGLVCSGADDVLSVNYHVPEKAYYEALTWTLNEVILPVLSDEKRNQNECLLEFAGHWNWAVKKEEKEKLLVVATPISFVEDLYIRTPIAKGPGLDALTIAHTHDFDRLSERYCLRIHSDSSSRRNQGKGCILTIRKLVVPPMPQQSIVEWWQDFLRQLDIKPRKQLREFARHRKSKQCWIVVQSEFQKQVIWFALKGVSHQKKYLPLSNDYIDGWDLSARNVDPHTKGNLLPRAGAASDLQDKRVTIVGCGSVGSLIAEQIASSGVGDVRLIDFEDFESNNLYRHTLDMSALGKLKAAALAANLAESYPFSKFSFNKARISDLSDDEVTTSDVIIVSIGNPTEERFFNEQLVNDDITVPVVYCWLEAYGVGGHAVFASADHRTGCLACNYYDSAEGPTLHSVMNFMCPNQPVTKDVGGCGSLFLPYSQLDASQTAILASRLALRFLNNKLQESVRVSWRGPSQDADSAGLELTHRYNRLLDPLKDQQYKQKGCPVCGK